MPEIQIDDEVWQMLKGRAEPFVDSPNSVIRRLLEMPASTNGTIGQPHAAPPSADGRRKRGLKPKARQSTPRAQTGTILADDEYELPLLTVLDELGGRAPTREALEALGERLRDKLMPADHEKLRAGEVRWRNRAQFVRLRLIQRGDMKQGSPRGLWEISDQGRDRLVS